MSNLKFQTNGFIGVILLFTLSCLSTTSVVADDKHECKKKSHSCNKSVKRKIKRASKAAPDNITDD
ncbi:MAG: hypothetical protein GY781_12020, partial [Gammaproteobacteria bacterium]|nr:hypothetical protein [Gammaproteobacteria bacterium]